MRLPLTMMSLPSALTSPGKAPWTLSRLNSQALDLASARSLIATSSSPQSGRSRIARATSRPMRPKPLIATLVISCPSFFRMSTTRAVIASAVSPKYSYSVFAPAPRRRSGRCRCAGRAGRCSAPSRWSSRPRSTRAGSRGSKRRAGCPRDRPRPARRSGSVHGIETTSAPMPCASSCSATPSAISTSEPVAIRITLRAAPARLQPIGAARAEVSACRLGPHRGEILPRSARARSARRWPAPSAQHSAVSTASAGR